MFTDIYGYSAKMSRDENAALTLLKEHNRLLSEVIERHSGRVLKTMGDAYFAEFDAAFSAVACAVEIQTALKEYNQDRPAYDRIVIRIGLHIGDVIVDGEDLYGEGVNVAARLQPLAEPGGICMSQAVYQAVKSHTSLEAVHHGEVELKNIVEKYVVYKVPSFDPQQSEGVAKVVERRVATDTERDVERRAAPGVLNFKVKSIQKWPTVGRSLFYHITKWAVRGYAVLGCLAIMTLIGGYASHYQRTNSHFWLSPEEIPSPVNFVKKLKESSDPVSQYIREHLSNLSRKNLEVTDSGVEIPLSTMIVLTGDVISIVNSKEPWFLPTYFASHPKDLSQQSKLTGSKKRLEIIEFNRSLFMKFYGNDVKLSHEKFIVEGWWRILKWVLPSILLLLCLHLMASKMSLKVSFSDARDLDNALSYITTELGYPPGVKEQSGVKFNRKGLIQRLVKDFGSLRAVVDGNLALLTGDRSTISKIRQLLKLHLEQT